MNRNHLLIAAVVIIGVIVSIVSRRTSRPSGAPVATTPQPVGPMYSTTQPTLSGEADTQADLDRAAELLRAGDATAAITIMRDAARRVAAARGAESPQHAAALYNLASVYMAAGDWPSAATTLETCCAIQPVDRQSTKDHLTYLMNLGDTYAEAGELAKAEKVHRDALPRRATFYGTDHAGYAYGLNSLAEVLLRQDRAAEALPLATRARDICRNSPSQLNPQTYATRAFAVKASGGDDATAFEGVDALPPDERAAFYQHLIAVGRHAQVAGCVATLAALSRRLESAADANDETRWNAAAALLNAARLRKDHVAWLACADRLIAAARKSGNRVALIEVLQNKAIALAESKGPAAELEAYQAALAEATALGDLRVLSTVHRNLGICLREQNKPDEAEKHFAAAVELARKAGAIEHLGAALAAHGIFVQHHGDLARARPMLAEAVRVIPPTHPDYLFAANHLNALDKDASCGCGQMDEAIAQAVKQMVRARLPADLLEDVQLTVKPGAKPNVQVRLKRQASAAELETVQTVVNQAVVELQRAARERSGGR